MPKRKLPPNEEIISLYRAGFSTGEIAERYGVKPVTVHSLLYRLKEPMRSTAEAAKLRTERGRSGTARYWAGKKQPREMVERRVSKIRGEKHWLWKGGTSRRHYRRIVDKDVCAQCGTSERLVIHHVDLNHYNNDLSNLIVLCASCHQSLHKQAYWDAYHAGKQTPKSNGPVGWTKKKKGGAE